LGYRNPIADREQIIWYFEQTAKSKHKNHLTRYWLNLKEWYAKKLLENEAFEVLAYITDKSTTAQEKKRLESRKKSKEKAQLEIEQFKKDWDVRKAKIELINQISMN
jgi:hypothetical protein